MPGVWRSTSMICRAASSDNVTDLYGELVPIAVKLDIGSIGFSSVRRLSRNCLTSCLRTDGS